MKWHELRPAGFLQTKEKAEVLAHLGKTLVGDKGQKSRSGGGKSRFEGGQMPYIETTQSRGSLIF